MAHKVGAMSSFKVKCHQRASTNTVCEKSRFYIGHDIWPFGLFWALENIKIRLSAALPGRSDVNFLFHSVAQALLHF